MKKTRSSARAKTPSEPVVAAATVPGAEYAAGGTWEWPRGLTGLVAGATLVFLAVFLFGVRQYAQHGAAIVHNMDRAVGSVAHEQAVRFEQAGDYAKAKECYLLALQGRFFNRGARSDALMRLGRLLRWHETPEAGLPYLRDALAQPDHDVAVFFALCEALVAAKQADETIRVAQQYYVEARKANDDELCAQAKYFEGEGLLAQGKKDAALAVFIEAEHLRSGGLSACEAGMLLYDRGDVEQAKGYLETCVYSSGSNQSEYAATLLQHMAKGKK